MGCLPKYDNEPGYRSDEEQDMKRVRRIMIESTYRNRNGFAHENSLSNKTTKIWKQVVNSSSCGDVAIRVWEPFYQE